jgi:hypothetical protein
VKRYIAFPASFRRLPLTLANVSVEQGNWTIQYGPTESGLYLLEATDSAIKALSSIYDGLYTFMEDFPPIKG